MHNPWIFGVFKWRERSLWRLPKKKHKHVLSNEVGVIFKGTLWVESRRQDHCWGSQVLRECLLHWLANKLLKKKTIKITKKVRLNCIHHIKQLYYNKVTITFWPLIILIISVIIAKPFCAEKGRSWWIAQLSSSLIEQNIMILEAAKLLLKISQPNNSLWVVGLMHDSDN